MNRRTPSRARSSSSAETDGGVIDLTALVTTGPKLPIAADFQPPVAAAELPPLDAERRPRRRTTK